jgi:hypothetical protein
LEAVEDDKVVATPVFEIIGDDSFAAAADPVEEEVILVGDEDIKALISFIGDDGSEFKDVMVNELILKEEYNNNN